MKRQELEMINFDMITQLVEFYAAKIMEINL